MNWLDRLYSLLWAAAVVWFMALLVRKLLWTAQLSAREFQICLAAGLLTIVYCAIRFIALKHHAHDHAGPAPAGAVRRGMTRSQL